MSALMKGMHLYNLTVQHGTLVSHVAHGNFSGPAPGGGRPHTEIVVARNKTIELYRCDPQTGRLHSMICSQVFGIVRSMLSFRLVGGTKDYLVLGSDSGRIAVLEFNPTKVTFDKVHMETFGKSGSRRIIPGQYLAADPKGRAIMIAAMEKQKFVYIMNRDAQARLTISSPLEAHHSSCIVQCIAAVDVGFENPIFAALETDYETLEEPPAPPDPSARPPRDPGSSILVDRVPGTMQLTFYELDLGLNHVVRKYSEPLDAPANYIIPIPGGNDGPSGVIVCCENYLVYKNFGDQPDIRCPIPRRRNDLDDAERGVLITCSAVHRTKNMFLVLAQTEQGDLFRVALDVDQGIVTALRLKYFDTVPTASSIAILKTGFLFVASEFGSHFFYQIVHLGDADDEPEFSSAIPLEQGDTFYFAPRGLKNLTPADEIDSLSPVLHFHVGHAPPPEAVGALESDPLSETPVVYAACGRSARAQLRVLRLGLEVNEMAVSELPANPNGVWTVKRKLNDEYDAFIIVSFPNATLVLSIGETVEEVMDSGFLGTTPTLGCAQMGDNTLVQIHSDGIRHIRADRRINEWRAPGGGRKQIVRCAVNNRQLVIALTGGELVYFEIDPSGQLNEYTERRELGSEVVCMSLGRVPPGELRCRFLAVGLADSVVRILSLDPDDCLQAMSMQALPALPEALSIIEFGGRSAPGARAAGAEAAAREEVADRSSGLYLLIGLQNGVLLRTVLDSVTGDLSDTRTRYLGAKPVKLLRVRVLGADAVLGLSSRSWLQYAYQGRQQLSSLSYEAIDYASGFSSEQCPEGIVAIAGNSLRILALERIGSVFNSSSIPLEQTPRRFVSHPERHLVYTIESDHRAYTQSSKIARRKHLAEEMLRQAETPEERQLAQEMAGAFLSEQLDERVFGQPRAAEGCWASIVRVIDPLKREVLQTVRLEQNDGVHCVSLFKFLYESALEQATIGADTDIGGWCLAVGGATGARLRPRACPQGGWLDAYRVLDDGRRLELMHRTPLETLPTALCPLGVAPSTRLLVGVGAVLRLFTVGKKRLLKKTELKMVSGSNQGFPTTIVDIQVMGDRIFVCDLQESVFVLRYKPTAPFYPLLVFAEDSGPKWITSLTILDYDTISFSDKFGNVHVMRVPTNTDAEALEARLSDPSGVKSVWDRAQTARLESVCVFHVGEYVSCMRKVSLAALGSILGAAPGEGTGEGECILYTTLAGSVGVLVPFRTRTELDFFQHLEMHLRAENISLVGRDHLQLRSSYFPCKAVIDGDLCEQFASLDAGKQRSIALELDRAPADILKKLDEMRARIAL